MKSPDANPSGSTTSSVPVGDQSNELSVTGVSEEPQPRNEPGESAIDQVDHTSSEDGDLERAQTAQDDTSPAHGQDLATVSTIGPVHSVFTKNQKRFIVVMASFGGFFSPVSSNIYFPALNALEKDLGVTSTLINLTLTSYMVCFSIRLLR